MPHSEQSHIVQTRLFNYRILCCALRIDAKTIGHYCTVLYFVLYSTGLYCIVHCYWLWKDLHVFAKICHHMAGQYILASHFTLNSDHYQSDTGHAVLHLLQTCVWNMFQDLSDQYNCRFQHPLSRLTGWHILFANSLSKSCWETLQFLL